MTNWFRVQVSRSVTSWRNLYNKKRHFCWSQLLQLRWILTWHLEPCLFTATPSILAIVMVSLQPFYLLIEARSHQCFKWFSIWSIVNKYKRLAFAKHRRRGLSIAPVHRNAFQSAVCLSYLCAQCLHFDARLNKALVTWSLIRSEHKVSLQVISEFWITEMSLNG